MKNNQQLLDQTKPVNNSQPESSLPIAQVSTPQLAPKKEAPYFLIGLIILLLGIAGVFAYKYYEVKQQLNGQEQTQSLPQLVVESSPSPTLTILPTLIPQSDQTLKSDTPSAITSASLASMVGWKNSEISNLSVKIPTQANIREGLCTLDYEECYLLENHDDSLLSPPHISIWVKAYNGGSRRLEADLEASDYTFDEIMFGDNKSLVGSYNCQTEDCISLKEIILVVGDKLIHITDGSYRGDNNSTVKESTITNAIIASLDINQ